MRNLTLILAILFTGWSVSASVNSVPANSYYSNYNDSYIFIEGGVEFAVYPNGEFDFYFNPEFRRGTSVQILSPNVNISYNSGYNYDPYIQYDDYGAVIQIETVPIYYDYYGRIIQAGNVYMSYNNFGYLSRVGNLHLHYDRFNRYTHYSGFINHFNPHYVFRPWHRYYQRPHVNVSIVFNRPYRAFYEPYRVSYNQYVTIYNNYYSHHNGRRNFYRPQDRVRDYNYGRIVAQRRDLRKINTRRDNQVARSRQQTARNKAYSERQENNRNYGSERTQRIQSSGKAVARNRQVKADKTYSQRMERSTDARGRSGRPEIGKGNRDISRNRSIQKTDRQQRSTFQKQRNRSSVDRAKGSTSRSKSFERSRNNSERNSNIKRQREQRSSAVRKSAPAKSRAGRVQKSSSRTRSSARIME